MPIIAKKRLIRKKKQEDYLSSSQKLASAQTLGSAFLDRIRTFQHSKFELDLLKIIDGYNDFYGSVPSDYISSVIKNQLPSNSL